MECVKLAILIDSSLLCYLEFNLLSAYWKLGQIYGLGEPEPYIILEALIKNKIKYVNTKLDAQVNAY